MKMNAFRALALCAAGAFVAAGTTGALAMDTIRFMKVVPNPYVFLIADVGVKHGIFEKHDIQLEISSSQGDARLQQAMAADVVDIGQSSGTSMGFVIKGAPVIAFLASHYAPLNQGLLVTPNSRLAAEGATVEDLKGAKIGVSSPSSLSYFLARRMAVELGWSPDDVTAVGLGAFPAQLAAAKAGSIDTFVVSVDSGYQLEEDGTGKVFLTFGDYIPNFITHALLVTNKFREENPDAVRRFSAAWLETVEFIANNKQAMVEAGMEVLGLSEDVASKSYDIEFPAFSRDGRFPADALDIIAEGLVDTGILPEKPDLSSTYTEEYLPQSN